MARYRDTEWRTKASLSPGKKGTTKEYEQYGDDLVCVRYRYDGKGMRIKTVEIVTEIKKVR